MLTTKEGKLVWVSLQAVRERQLFLVVGQCSFKIDSKIVKEFNISGGVRPAWSSEPMPGQPRVHRETLCESQFRKSAALSLCQMTFLVQ